MSNIWDYVNADSTLNKVIDALTVNQFLRESHADLVAELNPDYIYSDIELKKAVFYASILSLSENEKHIQKALSFGILAYLEKKDMPYAHLCYIILARTKNIHQGKHLTEFYNKTDGSFKRDSDVILDFELSSEQADFLLTLPNERIFMNKFQSELWKGLFTHNLLAVSAPTSAGKSFMLQNYIYQKCIMSENYKALYIVPTRALLYEVSNTLRKRLKEYDVSIKNYFNDSDEISNKEILILTPERCLNLLSYITEENYPIDLIFIDEIQKLEDGERGALYEYVLTELKTSFPNSKLVVAGPYLKKLDLTMEKIYGVRPALVESTVAPVYQTKAIFRFYKGCKNNLVLLKSATGEILSLNVTNKRKKYSAFKYRHTAEIPNFVLQYGSDSINIIYSPRRATAEAYAIKLAEQMDEHVSNERIKQLMDFLSSEIHPEYSLIRCLDKGVAFHHGLVPEIAKLEVEDLYKNEQIRNLSCTSTLLEGVNLPADKIFILKPVKNDKRTPLDDFEFGNLIGRAGRANVNLRGSVYCIERDDEPWSEEMIKEDFEKEIISTTDRTFSQHKEYLISNIYKKSTEIEAPNSVIYTLILLRQKGVKNRDELYSYLLNKLGNPDEASEITGMIISSLRTLTIPYPIIRLNPTIDPLLQDELFSTIQLDGPSDWLITKHPYSRDGISSRNENFADKTFYFQFEAIIEKLNYIFHIEQQINEKRSLDDSLSIRQLVRYAVPWIRQFPISRLIERKIEESPMNKIDSTIRIVVQYVNNDIRFDLVKYVKLLSDVFEIGFPSSLEYNKLISGLPEMIEFGASNPEVLNLMRAGISRSAAVQISQHIPAAYKDNPIQWLKRNKIVELSDIHKRYLVTQGFWDEI